MVRSFLQSKTVSFLRFAVSSHPVSLINLGNKLEHALLKIWFVEGKRFGAEIMSWKFFTV